MVLCTYLPVNLLKILPLFSAQWIVAAEILELVGVCLEGIAVAAGIIEAEGRVGGTTFLLIFGIVVEVCGNGRCLDVEVGRETEMAGYGFEGHAGATGLAIGRVAGDMWGAEEYFVEKFKVDSGFVFPGVDDGSTDFTLS